MHSVDDSSGAGPLPLAADIPILEGNHTSLDLENIPYALQRIFALSSSEPLLNVCEAILTDGGPICSRDF